MKASIVTENISSCICGLDFEQKLATMQGYPVGSCSLPFVSHLNLTTRRLKGNVLRSLIVLCSSSDYIPHVSLSIFKGTDWSAWNRSLCLATHAVILNRLDGFAKPRSSTKGDMHHVFTHRQVLWLADNPCADLPCPSGQRGSGLVLTGSL